MCQLFILTMALDTTKPGQIQELTRGGAQTGLVVSCCTLVAAGTVKFVIYDFARIVSPNTSMIIISDILNIQKSIAVLFMQKYYLQASVHIFFCKLILISLTILCGFSGKGGGGDGSVTFTSSAPCTGTINFQFVVTEPCHRLID